MKIRVCYGKTEAGSFLSHLDLARTAERSLRRAKAPLAFSEGFNPHPKISFASALGVGVTGEREYLDVELAARVNIGDFSRALAGALPPALCFVAAEEIDGHSKSLSATVNLAVYRIRTAVPPADEENVRAGVAAVLAARELWRKPQIKPGKKPGPAKEVRGLIRRLEIAGPQELECELRLATDGQLQPRELWAMIADAGGFSPGPPVAVCRRALLILQDGKVFGPMEGVQY